MTREESWHVEGLTLTLLRHIFGAGLCRQRVPFPSSLLGSRPACVEMLAVDTSTDPPTQHVARVVEGEAGDLDYRCAVLLAEAVGIELED